MCLNVIISMRFQYWKKNDSKRQASKLAHSDRIYRLYVYFEYHIEEYIHAMARHFLYPLYKFTWKIKYERGRDKSSINSIIDSNNREQVELYITNSAAGGTKFYTDSSPSRFRRVMFKTISYTKDFYYEISDETGEKALVKIDDVGDVFKKEYKRITINSLVGCNHSYDMIERICLYKVKHPDTELVSNIHDFFPVCPHKNLSAGMTFCDLQCEKFKCDIRQPDFTFRTDIDTWREKWNRLLGKCDLVNCFDESGKELLNRAYPGNKFNISVTPHSCLEMPYDNVKINKKQIHVGIVGDCSSISKGRYLIGEFLKKRGFDIPVTFVGTPKGKVKGPKKNVSFIGSYRREMLQKLIEDNEINVILFTSIIPETFSFVLSEVMAMGLPVISLDIGAQGHRVGKYEYGYVCKSVDGMVEVVKRMNRR